MSTAYRFDTPFPKGHFVRDYLEYAAKRTDASHAYHEAAGLALLALATPNVRARLDPYPLGLPTNLYVLVLGDSTRSRKSTAISLAADIADAAIPRGRIAEGFSPEAFVETLSARPRDSTLWAPDEFGETLLKLRNTKYMAGLVGLLLTLYAGGDYEARRHSKRIKGGDKVEDIDRIEAPNLTILGAATPAIFEGLTESDVTSGLLPRFAIVHPTTQPARKPFYDVQTGTETQRNGLVQRLHGIHHAAIGQSHAVEFQPGALEVLDAFAESLEESTETNEAAKTMQQRLTAMAIKVALLSAAGWSTGLPTTGPLPVSVQDGEMAVTTVRRWAADAKTFAARVGETQFETKLAKCLRLVQQHTAIPRNDIARAVHVPKKLMDEIEATLLDREQIVTAEKPSDHGPNQLLWCIPRSYRLKVVD